MQFRTGLLIAVALAPALFAQTEPQLTARELFYTPVAKAAAAPQPKPVETKPVAAEPTKRRPSTTNTARTDKPRPASPDVPDPGEAQYRAARAKEGQVATLEGGATVQNASTSYQTVNVPLALRYSILKRNDNGDYLEVDPETIFRSGDKIRVSVESNDAAYLYIVQQGSSKTWSVLFPNQDTEGGSNFVAPNRRYVIPNEARFTFDEQPGSERIFVVLSRMPEENLESLIYSLNRPTTPTPTAAPAPSSTRNKLLIASSRLEDSHLNRVRDNFISRDLVFEKVTEDKPSTQGKREKAIYYATNDRSSKARLVIDLKLQHQ